MRIECQEILNSLQSTSLIQSCDRSDGELVRLLTPFRYPDGSQVDLFVLPSEPIFGKVAVSDYGQTLDWLSDFGVNPTATKRRKLWIADVCRKLDVEFDGWQIRIEAIGLSEITGALLRVGQACIRVSDLIATQRLTINSALKTDIEEFIADMGLDYDIDADLPSIKGGNLVHVDFRVWGHTPARRST